MTTNNTPASYVKMAPWLNWIEQPPPKGQVAGSNPAGVATKHKRRHYYLIFEIGIRDENKSLFTTYFYKYSFDRV